MVVIGFDFSNVTTNRASVRSANHNNDICNGIKKREENHVSLDDTQENALGFQPETLI